jgi:hypothetical protein
MEIARILSCARDHWTFGDPNAVGWFTVFAYLVAAVLAFRVAADDRAASGAERAFWAAAGLFLAFLAVNKQLDLQSLLTAAGRCAAKLQGWYGMRRTVQFDFVLTLAGLSAVAMITALWLLGRALRRTWLALLGLVWIGGFVLIRAVGFLHVDELIGLRLAGVRLNWVFELGGIGIFTLGAGLALARAAKALAPSGPAGTGGDEDPGERGQQPDRPALIAVDRRREAAEDRRIDEKAQDHHRGRL